MDLKNLEPTKPFEVDEKSCVRDVLQRMKGISFQGRNLASVQDVWERMLADNTTIFMGLAGAMVPAGMRKIIAYLIEKRYIDCLVSTGANLFHDIHESLGKYHYIGSKEADDKKLLEEGIDRIYDTFAREEEFRDTDEFLNRFAASVDTGEPISTREFFFRLGTHLNERGCRKGIISASARSGVPVYCPAIGDSSIGIGIAVGRKRDAGTFNFDVIKDVVETADIAAASSKSGVIYLGGGTPKNFIQQTEVTASIWGDRVEGHHYAVQIIADSPHWGGLSGCTFEEAQSWGKIASGATKATYHGDITAVLPFIATALAQSGIVRKNKPAFNIEKKNLF